MTEPGAGPLIRSPRQQDLEQITAIYNEAIEDGVSNCDLSGIPETELNGWLDTHQGRFPLFVTEVEREVAGWACLSPFVSKECFNRTAYTSTYVGKRFRRHGIGLALREHVIAQARVLGFHCLVNRIFTRNSASLALTERLGFTQIGLLREVIWRDGDYWDAVLYQLMLVPETQARLPDHGRSATGTSEQTPEGR
jgi:L-amino acid N-acyltransferase